MRYAPALVTLLYPTPEGPCVIWEPIGELEGESTFEVK